MRNLFDFDPARHGSRHDWLTLAGKSALTLLWAGAGSALMAFGVRRQSGAAQALSFTIMVILGLMAIAMLAALAWSLWRARSAHDAVLPPGYEHAKTVTTGVGASFEIRRRDDGIGLVATRGGLSVIGKPGRREVGARFNVLATTQYWTDVLREQPPADVPVELLWELPSTADALLFVIEDDTVLWTVGVPEGFRKVWLWLPENDPMLNAVLFLTD